MKIQQQGKKIKPITQEIFPEEDFDQKYKIKKIIGKGQYGYVAKAIRRKDNSYVAVKKIFPIFQNVFQTKRIVRQIILLKNCKHPNIVSLLEIFLPKNQTLENFNIIYIVTEFCDADLQKLFKMEETFLNIQDVKHIMYQITCALKYLHSASIIHRDLTPSNILINGKGMEVKICDLGLARVVQKVKVQENEEEQSSDSQNQEKSLIGNMKNMTQQQKKALVKQMVNKFENIDMQSLPSTPTQQNFQAQMNFSNSNDQFCRIRSISNQKNQIKQQKQEITQKGKQQQFDFLRGSVKNQHETKITKKKKLLRQGSKRASQKDFSENVFSNKIQQLKIQKKEKKSIYKSCYTKLTLRVTTRWYRAPQIILLEKGYNKPIDIWSLGCLFGELLKMQKSICYNSLQRFPLFPGKYCYPLSPQTLTNVYSQQKKQIQSKFNNDQLFMIISTIGKPSEEQISFLTDQSAKQYIRNMDQFPRKIFKKIFPAISDEISQILEKTLVFDPRKRMTIDEIIQHKFFDSVRKSQLQISVNPLIMEFQNEEQLTSEILKKYLVQQIKEYF